MRHDHDSSRVDPERFAQRVGDELARHGSCRRPGDRPWQAVTEVGATGGREVLRVGEVLHVVDREQCRRRAPAQRQGAPGVVHDVGAAERPRPGQRLGEQAGRPIPRDGPTSDQFEAAGELGMGRGEARRHEETGRDFRSDRRQPDELAGEVLLRPADLAGPAPQQVDPDAQRHRLRSS